MVVLTGKLCQGEVQQVLQVRWGKPWSYLHGWIAGKYFVYLSMVPFENIKNSDSTLVYSMLNEQNN